MNCHWCSGDHVQFVYALNDFSLFRCDRCNLAKIYPIPTAETLVRYYSGSDTNIAKGNARSEIQAFLENPAQAIQIIREPRLDPLEQLGELFHDKQSVILDVGCGGGTFLAALQHLGYENVCGLELNADSVRMIREHLGIHVVESGIAATPELPPADIVTSFDVLEHVPDPRESLREINRMLKVGGGLHLRVPNFGSLCSKLLGTRWLWALPPYHLNYFTPAVLGSMVAASGFEVQRVWTAASGYRLAFLTLQANKLLKNSVEVSTFKTSAYSPWKFRCINLAESLTRALLFPYSVIVQKLNLDDCLHVVARKRTDV